MVSVWQDALGLLTKPFVKRHKRRLEARIRGSKADLARSNAIDVNLGLLKWNEDRKEYQSTRARSNHIDFLVIGHPEAAAKLIYSFRDEQREDEDDPSSSGEPCRWVIPDASSERTAEVLGRLDHRRTQQADIYAELHSLAQPVTSQYGHGLENEVEVLGQSYLLFSLTQSISPKISPESILADSAADEIYHRTATARITTIDVRRRHRSYTYKFHLCNDLDPTHHRIARQFADISHVFFVVDHALLGTIDATTGLPYLTMILDLFTRLITNTTRLFTRQFNVYIMLVNTDHMDQKISTKHENTEAFLSEVDPNFEAEDLHPLLSRSNIQSSDQYPERQKLALHYVIKLLQDIVEKHDANMYASIWMHAVPNLDNREIGRFLMSAIDESILLMYSRPVCMAF